MIQLVIFDLDGVLIDTKNIHFTTLNSAIKKYSPGHEISWNDHLSKYDGLKTRQKLELLSSENSLDERLHNLIWTEKQKLTMHELLNTNPSKELLSLFKKLSSDGYKIACCSNSIRKTVLTILSKLSIIEYFDIVISNEDVLNGKPHPEMYWKCISEMRCLPENTLIIEDSPYGLLAAHRSHSCVLRVSSPDEVKIKNIYSKMEEINSIGRKSPKWTDRKLNVIVPMAGAGSRFEKAGYTFPKPLIDIKGEPMIKLVTENLNLDANFIYVVQKSHKEKYNLEVLLNLISPNCRIVEVDGITEGAACTTLLAKHLIDNDHPLILANSDQFMEWDSNEFMYKMKETDADCGIVTFKSTHPKWSFVKLGESNYVCEVAEKKPISDMATAGIYYWKRGSDYVRYAEQMIQKDIRVGNEFYVCPVFNEAISDGKKVLTYSIDKMWGLGTPEDLMDYLGKN